VRSIRSASTAAAAAELEFRAGDAGSEHDAIETPIVDSCADAASLSVVSNDAARAIGIGIAIAPPPSRAVALVCALMPTLALVLILALILAPMLALALAPTPSVAQSAAADSGADRTGELPADRVGSVAPRAAIEGRPYDEDEDADGLRCKRGGRGRKGDTKER
jgi:hypothetical protein